MHQRNLPLEDADEEQIQLANELMDMGKKKKNTSSKKDLFLNNAVLVIRAREKILNNFKGKKFTTKNAEPAPDWEPEPTVFASPKKRTN